MGIDSPARKEYIETRKEEGVERRKGLRGTHSPSLPRALFSAAIEPVYLVGRRQQRAEKSGRTDGNDPRASRLTETREALVFRDSASGYAFPRGFVGLSWGKSDGGGAFSNAYECGEGTS